MNEHEAKNYEYNFLKSHYIKITLIHFAFYILELHRCSNKRKHLNFSRHFLSVTTACFTAISGVFLVLYTGLHFLKIEIQQKTRPDIVWLKVSLYYWYGENSTTSCNFTFIILLEIYVKWIILSYVLMERFNSAAFFFK